MAYAKLILLDIIENNLKYIFEGSNDQDGTPYKETYESELNRIADDTQKYYIDSHLYTREEMITLLRAEFIQTFHPHCIDHNRAIFERILYEYYERTRN